MPLHMTKIAFRSKGVDNLRRWVEAGSRAEMTTRYLPKRHEEMIGGSLYWILDHTIKARSPIQSFEQRPDGRWTIWLEPKLILVHPTPKRAHQGWRYLAEDAAPRDLAEGEDVGEILPARLAGKLQKLGLI